MPLHLKGSQLVVDLLDAADHIDRIERDEHRALLRRAAETVANLIKEDIPGGPLNDRSLNGSTAKTGPSTG